MQALQFQGLTAVVTGAASGIGLAIGTSFARRGAHVFLADVDHETAEREAWALRREGLEVVSLHVDVSSESSVRQLADTVFDARGRVDILVNNAGVALQHLQPMWAASAADFRWLMDVNYHGVVHGLLAFVPRMRLQADRKYIVNTSSMATLRTPRGHSMYAPSKAAVDSITACLRAELEDAGDDFHIALLHPGPVRTRIKGSERLRVEDDRTEARGVVEYQPNAGYTYPTVIEDPAEVGEMVVAMLEAGRTRCLTHASPDEELRSVLEEINAGFVAG